jgi:uncharacterized protein (UPF0305 family)
VIYEYPGPDAPIRQGDIFIGVPRIEVSLGRVPIIDEGGAVTDADWREIASRGEEVTAVLPLRPVVAIVATQDCDAIHGRDITLCEIRPFRDVERKASQTAAPRKWKDILTQHARINQKWFYLPPDERAGFVDKMAVDFMVTLRVPRAGLESLRDLRKARLNAVADEHFRERIGEFFRRYPYDEWYPLNSEELAAYLQDYPETEPYPWQSLKASK